MAAEGVAGVGTTGAVAATAVGAAHEGVTGGQAAGAAAGEIAGSRGATAMVLGAGAMGAERAAAMTEATAPTPTEGLELVPQGGLTGLQTCATWGLGWRLQVSQASWVPQAAGIGR